MTANSKMDELEKYSTYRIEMGDKYYLKNNTCVRTTEEYGSDKFYSKVKCHSIYDNSVTIEKTFMTTDGKHHTMRAEEFIANLYELER